MIESFILRFEPGSKRICILEPKSRKITPLDVTSLTTQLSATDETSSVEATPRTPRDTDEEEERDIILNKENGLVRGDTIPRLRKYNRQDSLAERPTVKRKNTLTTEMGGDISEILQDGPVDNDDNKYGAKKRWNKSREEEEGDANWLHIAILFIFIAIAFVGVPWLFQWLGHPSPY